MKEYGKKIDRLQMSLFSMLYRYAGGFLIVPDKVFKDIEKTEWGNNYNFNKCKKVIFDLYCEEASETLDQINKITPRDKLYGDSKCADKRFGTDEARPNERMKNAYKEFVMKVGDELNIKFDYNFTYFNSTKYVKG